VTPCAAMEARGGGTDFEDEGETGMPVRIQRKRTKGWKRPEGAEYVGRPSKWGNRFVVNPTRDPEGFYADYRKNVDLWDSWPLADAQTAVRAFREMQAGMYEPNEIAELRGKDLMCWCPLDQPCHADVLLELANKP
jgi:hypothetical protein